MGTPMIVDPPRNCETCGVPLARKRFKSGRLEDRGAFLKRRHCSLRCANTRRVVQEDSHRWRARQIHRKVACEQCGATERLHVHHKDRRPANNDPSNLMTLCASCHLKLHWREDRNRRLASIGASTAQRLNGGRGSSAGRRRTRRSSALAETVAYPGISSSS